MNIQDAFYHARIQHVRTVVDALGQARINKGMTAFEDGDSNWGECFFARAFEGEIDLRHPAKPEELIMKATGIKTRVPIRFCWQAFDSARSTGIDRAQLKRLLTDILAQKNTDAVNELISSLQFDQDKPCELVCV